MRTSSQPRMSGPSLKRLMILMLAAVVVLPAVLPQATSAREVELKLNLNPGDEFRQELTIDQLTDMQAGPQQILMEILVTITMHTQVLERTDSGNLAVKVDFERVRGEADGPMGRGAWDSKNGGAPNNPMLLGFAAVHGLELTYELAPDGKVSNVQGFEGMTDRLLDAMNAQGPMRDQVRAAIETQMSGDTMKELIESSYTAYPDGPIDLGDTWDQTVDLKGFAPLNVNVEYTLTAADGQTATADINGKLATKPDAKMEVMPNVHMGMQLDGTQKGSCVFNLANGWVESMEINQTLKGSITTPEGQGPNGESIEMPMAIDTTVTIKSLPVE